MLKLAVVAALCWYGYTKYVDGTERASLRSASLPANAGEPDYRRPSVASFSCDGRTHCSQMTSCAEATFFIRNCPNTKMDGDRDGVPCEQQWCN
jgi:hypothetical protein